MVPLLAMALALASSDASVARRLEDASVTLRSGGCGGAVAGDPEHVLTAAHCLRSRTAEVELRLSNGEIVSATPEVVLEGQDVAILRLDEPAPVEPLPIRETLPSAGAAVFFRSRMAGGDAPLQSARVVRLAPCPSLPGVAAALHTSIRGRPGDSGSPLVDDEARIVGLVHGGARCSIAAPTSVAAPVVAQLARTGAQCVAAGAPAQALGVGGSGPSPE